MLRQIHILSEGKVKFTQNLALALDDNELANLTKAIESYITMPMPGKTFQRPFSSYQAFHRSEGNHYFILITDLSDSLNYVDKIFKKITAFFKKNIAEASKLDENQSMRKDFISHLEEMQAELHSKISIIGPTKSGRTTLFNNLKSGEERQIMNFAKSSTFKIDNLQFDIWDFILDDNFSLLWSKFIGGSDLTIFVFDLSGYNSKIINHFLELHKNEGKLSKILILGNKCDKLTEEEIKNNKDALGLPEIDEISLEAPNSEEKILGLIREKLRLKKPLPSNYDVLKSDAENQAQEGKIDEAIKTYTELLKIGNKYQVFEDIPQFKSKLEELAVKKKQLLEEEKEEKRKKKFSRPEKKQFGQKISVKTLPGAKPLPKPKTLPTQGAKKVKVKTLPVQKGQKTVKTKIKPVSLGPKGQSSPKPVKNKLTLSPEDVKITIKPSFKKKKPTQDKMSFEDIEHLIEIKKYDLALRGLIRNEGSDLNPKLCKKYASELKNVLNRDLTQTDLRVAVENFIQLEKAQ